ncbi:McrC family protein [Sphingobacterium sp. Lzh-3]|uniref:McrC family protein n=1 Tax=Sphingobacterium sp. Lzh-3 TaxID=3382150 RepID=UPI00398D4B7F
MQYVLQVYEHDTLYLNQSYTTVTGDNLRFAELYFNVLLKYNELHQGKYFAPVYQGIRFKSYVGILQVDDLVIEILPKIQRTPTTVNWRDVLIEMLRETDRLKITEVGEAFVDKQQIHLLDIYFDWFLTEVEELLHGGLVKQYYQETKDTLALKGKLEFVGHLQRNLIHQERFYNTHQVYGTDHRFHQILHLGLEVVARLSRGTYRYGRCKTAQLNFPEVREIRADEQLFERLSYSRKTESYRTAIELARLIILNYAPNVKAGQENMLALLFNMNELWEQYVLTQLLNYSKDWTIWGQESKRFWRDKTLRPDILLRHRTSGKQFVIDTKWKNYSYDTISSQDLRQIYVYADYWDAVGGMLLYPHTETLKKDELCATYHGKAYVAQIGLLSILDEGGSLNKNLGKDILGLIDFT